MPAAINFLSGILHMAIPKTGVKLIKVLPPFKAVSSHLVVVEDFSSIVFDDSKISCSNLLSLEIDESFKVEVFCTSIKILEEFHSHYEDLPSCVEIFSSVLRYLEAIPMDKYPEIARKLHSRFLNTLRNSRDHRSLPYLVSKPKKPKALKMLEPKFEQM